MDVVQNPSISLTDSESVAQIEKSSVVNGAPTFKVIDPSEPSERETIPNGCIKQFVGKNHATKGNVKQNNELVNSASLCKDESNSIQEITSLLSDATMVVHKQSKTSDANQEDELANDAEHDIDYVVYESELQMPDIMRLITKDLSEPYSIYTYRYFIHNWPKLCYLAFDKRKCIGAIVCKLDMNKRMVRRGYIAMLAVDKDYRRRKIGSSLVQKAIRAMIADDCDEVVLETEITNKAALHLYENLGFVRDKRLFRYYLNGVDALRLKLWLS